MERDFKKEHIVSDRTRGNGFKWRKVMFKLGIGGKNALL